MQVTVTTQTQAIFPDGQQDPMVIRNDGPATIYVDSDSSVASGSGHAVPPTGVLAWDQNRPLWVVTDNTSSNAVASVTITRNSQAANFSNFIDKVLLKDTFNSANNYVSPILECSAFETLVMELNCPSLELNGPPYIYGTFWATDIIFYDSSMNLIGKYPVAIQPYWGSYVNPTDIHWSRARVPILGTYFQIATGGVIGGQALIRAVGTTRKLDTGMSMGYYDATPWDTQVGDAVNWVTGFRSSSADLSKNPNTTLSFYLPGVTPNLRIAWAFSAGSTVAGTLKMVNTRNLNLHYNADQALPIGSISHLDVILPVTELVLCLITLPSAPIPATRFIHFTWS